MLLDEEEGISLDAGYVASVSSSEDTYPVDDSCYLCTRTSFVCLLDYIPETRLSPGSPVQPEQSGERNETNMTHSSELPQYRQQILAIE